MLTVGAGVVGHAEGTALLELRASSSRSATSTRRCSRTPGRGSRDDPHERARSRQTSTSCSSLSPPPRSEGAIDLRHLEAGGGHDRRCAREGLVVGTRTISGRHRPEHRPTGDDEDVVIPLLEANAGLRAGVDFGVCVSPEYLRQRVAVSDSVAPRLVVIGQLDARSGDVAERLNAGFGVRSIRVPIRDAEFHKYAHNLCNASKIALLQRAAACRDRHRGRRRAGVRARRKSSEAVWNPEYGTLDLGPVRRSVSPEGSRSVLGLGGSRRPGSPHHSAVGQSNDPDGSTMTECLRWSSSLGSPPSCVCGDDPGGNPARPPNRASARSPAPDAVDHPDHHRGQRGAP